MRFRSLSRLSALLASASAIAGAACLMAAPAGAAPQQAAGARMVVEAKEMVYDEKKNTVTARGQVQILYKGRLLEADRVVYDRNTSRVYAEGNARLTETNGTVARAERFDFTDDFKAGFIESLQVDTTDNTHFSAPRAERAGDATIFDMGAYTACEACKDDPSKPRTWSLKAKRIIHDNAEKMIYYEDASFELLGLPIAYVPFWSSPDPSVKRKSGFLTPAFTYRSQLGAGFGIPYFWALAPDYDLTITPMFFTRQGPFVTAEFRKRFDNGGFTFRAEGTHVGDPGAFAQAPLGAGGKEWRGAIQTMGDFWLNDRWRAGWDITALSDRYFLQDYKQYNFLLQNYFFREASSTIYLSGQGPRSFFDMRGYYFQGLSPNDVQAQQSVVHPVIDYNRAFDIEPALTSGIGGQVEVDANVASTSADLANYESINPRTLDRFYGLYNVCQAYTRDIVPQRSRCLLRGVGGDYQHATISANWKRKVIDPIGGVWTPFAFARFVGSYLDYDRQGRFPIYNNALEPIPNANQGLFFDGQDNRFRGQATPGVGVEWRYPILARSPFGAIVFEPIAQLIARPNQTSIPSLVNMDAQSLVFDDSNLFEWSKFSGYNRFETGTRINYGGQATLAFANGGFINAMIGQSSQLAGANSYSTAEARAAIRQLCVPAGHRLRRATPGPFRQRSLQPHEELLRQRHRHLRHEPLPLQYLHDSTDWHDADHRHQPDRNGAAVLGRGARRGRRLSRRMHDARDQLFADLPAAILYRPAGAQSDGHGHPAAAHPRRGAVQLRHRLHARERRRAQPAPPLTRRPRSMTAAREPC